MKKLVFSFVLFWFLAGCSKVEVVKNDQKVEIINGILKFENLGHFEQVKNSLKNNNLSKEELQLISSFHSFEKEVNKELSIQEKELVIKNNGSNLIYLKKYESGEIEALPQVTSPILKKLLIKMV